MESLAAYIPADRRQAMASGRSLPSVATGAALFADISGFTPLTEALAGEYGPQRGAEELTHHLNVVYDALINRLDRYQGSVVGFSGDAITCWFDGDDGLRAATCALDMQQAMDECSAVVMPSGRQVTLSMKVAIAGGQARRFVVGDPGIQLIDVLAGGILDQLAAAEHTARSREVVLTAQAHDRLPCEASVVEWRTDEAGMRFAVVRALSRTAPLEPWPSLPPEALTDEQTRPWLLPAVYNRLASGLGDFLAELRPAVALFLRFGGIDYDHDPDASAKLDQFIRRAQHIVTRYDGVLLQLTIGDKGSYLYAAFGAPMAHEDIAARAVSVAAELREMARTTASIGDVQIGITRGRMRTGAYGGALRRTYGVLGDEVNLSARLMMAAQPGQILASQPVSQSTADTFEWEQLPDIRVKGKSAPVALYRLAGKRDRWGGHLQEPAYALPMVGREVELDHLRGALAQAQQGHGQIVGITGEAGMGKSRLVAETTRDAQGQGFEVFMGECQSYGLNAGYLVWQSVWAEFFGLESGLSLERSVPVLERALSLLNPALLDRLPLLGAALNLPIPDNDMTRALDAKSRKTSLEALLVECVRARLGARPGASVRAAPILFVLEDCQWLDALSHDLLEALGRAIANLPVIIVMAYRLPELERLKSPRVSPLPYFSEIELREFTPQEARHLIDLKLAHLFGAHAAAPPALVERITARAQGNPFYIEELLNYLQDRGVDPKDTGALERLELPASLHSLILTRIDTLTESQRSTLRVASVIGRLFRAAALWGAYPQLGQPERIEQDLILLSRLELILPEGEPELAYLFKHIVTQEVAYESLPFATRAMLHELIGDYIERGAGNALDQAVDLLAFHFDRSHNLPKRRLYLLRAGEAAQSSYANAAAIDYYERVLPLLDEAEQIPAGLKLGQVLELVGRRAEAAGQYQRAIGSAERLADRRAEARSQAALGDLLRKQGDYAAAAEWLKRAQDTFEEVRDEAGVGQVLHVSGSMAAQQGNDDVARSRYERSLAIRRGLGDRSNVANLLSNLGILARRRGDREAARAQHEESLVIRRELGDRRAIAVSLSNLGNLALDQGELAEARARLEEAVALQRQVGDRTYIANALNNLGNVARAQGDYAGASGMYRESLTINRDLGDRWGIAYALEDIGCLAALEGQPRRAMRLVGAADALRQAIGAPLAANERTRLGQSLEVCIAALGEQASQDAFAEGGSMALDRAIEEALSG